MKEFCSDMVKLSVAFFIIFIVIAGGRFIDIYDAKTALEIKVLQYELKAYEEMDKEIKSE